MTPITSTATPIDPQLKARAPVQKPKRFETLVRERLEAIPGYKIPSIEGLKQRVELLRETQDVPRNMKF